MKTDKDTLIGAVIDQRFEIRDKLGQGGMGTVYRAWQRSIGRDVAIKLIDRTMSRDPTWVQRFLREAQLASQLSHPNTISVFDSGQMPDGRLFTAMELLRGRTLGKVLNADGPFPLARVVRIGTQICDALEAAHALRIVHRDLKLENVMILDQGSDLVKVLDFGLAKALDDKTTTATMAGVVLGTPGYIPPEGAMTGESSPASDLYALGVILAELSMAAHLWEGKSLGLILQQQLDPAAALAKVQQPVRGIVARLLDPKPAQRPTATQTRALLVDALAGKQLAPEAEFRATAPMKKAPEPVATVAQQAQYVTEQAMVTVPDRPRPVSNLAGAPHQARQPVQPPVPSATDLATTIPRMKAARPGDDKPLPRSGVRPTRKPWPLIGAGAAAFVASIVIAYVATREPASVQPVTRSRDAGLFDKLATTAPSPTAPSPTAPSPTAPPPLAPDTAVATDDEWPIVEESGSADAAVDTVTITVVGIPNASAIHQGDIKGPIVTSPFELAQSTKSIWFVVMKDRELVTSRYIKPDVDQTVDFTPKDLKSCRFGTTYKPHCLALYCRTNPDIPECRPPTKSKDDALDIKNPFKDATKPSGAKKPRKTDDVLDPFD